MDKKEQILKAALKVFAEHGVHGTAVPEIARAARVGVGSVYRYFPSKDALVNELFRDTKRRLQARLVSGLDLTRPPRVLFDDLWAGLVAFADEEPQAFQFLELQDHLSYLDARSRAVESEVLEPIWFLCKELQGRKIIDPRLGAEATMALVWGAFVGVFKARRNGYLKLRKGETELVRDACWRAIAGEKAGK